MTQTTCTDNPTATSADCGVARPYSRRWIALFVILAAEVMDEGVIWTGRCGHSLRWELLSRRPNRADAVMDSPARNIPVI